MKKNVRDSIKGKSIDIFCEVIDNFGDVAVLTRLARQLAKAEANVRIFVSRTKELLILNEDLSDEDMQCHEKICYMTYHHLEKNIDNIEPAEIIIEGFACFINEKYLEKAKQKSKLLINLEYLTSEDFAFDCHGLESPLGDCQLKKYFYIPGFSEKLGGVIVDEESLKLRCDSSECDVCGNDFKMLIFSYEKNYDKLFEKLMRLENSIYVKFLSEKVLANYANIYMKKEYKKQVQAVYIDSMSQKHYQDEVMCTDFKIVRGEDSFVHAVIVGKPFIWHAYFQEDGVHLKKIEGFFKRYREYFDKNHKDVYNNEVDILEKLFLDFNDRKENSHLEPAKENYDDFFYHYETIATMSKLFAEHVKKDCNLVDKLCVFIENKLATSNTKI